MKKRGGSTEEKAEKGKNYTRYAPIGRLMGKREKGDVVDGVVFDREVRSLGGRRNGQEGHEQSRPKII